MDPKVCTVSRSQWRAVQPKWTERLKGSAKRVVIHHTAMATCKDLEECKKQVLGIQRFHMEERDFDDIGYNFLVGADGVVLEGRGWGVVGAHAKGNNHDSVGIAFMGNSNVDSPGPGVIRSIKHLLQSGVYGGFIDPKFTLLGHRDLGDTQCPGDKLYAALPELGGSAKCLPPVLKASLSLVGFL